ncbi:MAG: uracil-DNA glycosylase [Candidatus Bipolaricaulia bacterium]
MADLFSAELEGLSLDELEERAREGCRKLWEEIYGGVNFVFGEGNPNADLMFIGEALGVEEDRLGRPFVGRAGRKLDEVLESVGIRRQDVYITNVIKARPPGNRTPQADEIELSYPYLEAQIAIINPKIIVTLGNVATQALLKTTQGINALRGRFHPWRGGIQVFPMFHPSYLLRNPSREKGSPKYLTWLDIQKVKQALEAETAV